MCVAEINLRKIIVHFRGERRRQWKIESTSLYTNGTNGDNDHLQMNPITGLLLSHSQVFRAFMRVQLLSRQKADEKVVDRITPR